MKPLLTRIEEELAVCTDPYRRAELLGEKGCYLARVGEFGVAHEIVAALRSEAGTATEGRVAVRIMFLEGLLLLFEHMDGKCRDRILRAHVIGHAAGYSDLARLSAAWLALIDMGADKFEDVFRMLAYTLGPSSTLEDEATIRAQLVLADLNMLAGRVDLAKGMYETARRGSVAVGDDSAIAATFYNRANMLLNHERICAAIGTTGGETRRRLELEIRSVDLYHRGSRQTSLSHLLESMNAMFLFLEEKFLKAAELYRRILATGRVLNIGADDSILALEYSICLLSTGQADQARDVLSLVERAPIGRQLFDDDLIVASLKSRLASEFGISVSIDAGGGGIQAALARYQVAVDRLGRLLDAFAAPVYAR